MAYSFFMLFMLIIAAIALAVVFFGTWVFFVIGRILALALGLGGPRTMPARRSIAAPRPASLMPMQRCPRSNCRHDNPMEALFCRRCGAALQAGALAGQSAAVVAQPPVVASQPAAETERNVGSAA